MHFWIAAAVITVVAIGFASAQSVESRPGKTWKAGAARVCITPKASMDMIGFADRKKPGAGAVSELYARVLALEDPQGRQLVLVAANVCMLPDQFNESVAKEIGRRHGLSREQIMLCVSHTHHGPLVRGDGLPTAAAQAAIAATAPATASAPAAVDESATDDISQRPAAYGRRLRRLLLNAVDEATAHLEPAELSWGVGKCTLSVNRRKMVNGEAWSFVQNPDGVVDQAVPVLKVASPAGQLRTVVFGYACHNTVLGGPPGGEGTWAKYVERHGGMPEHYYMWSGDYEGFAEADLENASPGATAMYVAGCGGDIMAPRSPDDQIVEHSQKFGRQMADAVGAVLAGQMTPVAGNAHAAITTLDLKVEKAGQARDPVRYPVQAWQLGSNLTWVALAGESVVDYSLRLKSELGQTTWVTAYANSVRCYVPSKRLLQEGGYEASLSGGAKFVPQIEDQIVAAAQELVAAVRGGTAQTKPAP